jgi:hypothetical protein
MSKVSTDTALWQYDRISVQRGAFARHNRRDVMKNLRISTGGSKFFEGLSIKDFPEKLRTTPLGKLFDKLVSDSSERLSDYSVACHFFENPGLEICHSFFPPNKILWVPEEDITAETTVRDIETRIYRHLEYLKVHQHAEIKERTNKLAAIARESEKLREHLLRQPFG